MCFTESTSVYRSGSTALCERASNVVAPINLNAFCVGRTLTVCPSSVKPRITPAALYAAMPPVTPTRIRKVTQISFWLLKRLLHPLRFRALR